MISVIVLTYNQEQYIRQTLDSILMQQVDEPVEIIIGDDHSSDTTSAMCRTYQEKYPDTIRYFYNTPNLGLVANFVAMHKPRGVLDTTRLSQFVGDGSPIHMFHEKIDSI